MGHNDYEGTWTLDDGEKLTLRHIIPKILARKH